MKNSEIIALVNNGAAAFTNYSLSPAHAYKAFKFKKVLKKAFDSIAANEQELPKEAGIEDSKAFDDKFKELREIENPTEEQKKELEECKAKYEKFIDLRQQLLNDDTPLEGIKTLPYEEWFSLRYENKALKLANGREVEVFPDWAEEILEGVLWEAPEEE